jgi:hypothetical protein
LCAFPRVFFFGVVGILPPPPPPPKVYASMAIGSRLNARATSMAAKLVGLGLFCFGSSPATHFSPSPAEGGGRPCFPCITNFFLDGGAGFWAKNTSGQRPFFNAIFNTEPLFSVSFPLASRRQAIACGAEQDPIQLFQEGGTVREWAFRSELDRFVVPFGMICAFVAARFRSELAAAFPGARSGVEPRWAAVLSWLVGRPALVLLMSLAVFASYVFYATTCTDKVACNAVHAWASLFPIAAYVAARNAWPAARGTFSAVMAVVGQNSLELFLVQYHVWLAHDTKALLTLVPGYWLLNAAATTVVFVAVSLQLNTTLGYFARLLTPEGDALAALTRCSTLVVVAVAFALLDHAALSLATAA